MIRGTTPTHIFNIPFDSSLLEKVMIIYAQNDEEVLVKEIKDCEINGKTITVKLTQEETLKFNCEKMLNIQLKVKTSDGDVFASQIMTFNVLKCLNGEVI